MISKIITGISRVSRVAAGKMPLLKVFFKGHESDTLILNSYGFFSNPKPGCLSVILQSCEGSEVKYSITQDVKNIPEGLSAGDVSVFNPTTGDRLILRASGGIEATGNLSINGDLSIDGELSCTGDAVIDGELECSDAVIGGVRFSTHTHNFIEDNTPGVPKPTLGPNP